MSQSNIPVARLEVIAAAAGVALLTYRRRIAAGRFPTADVRLPGRGNERGWSLPTIEAHDPKLADKVQRILTALEVSQ
jgi:hypothetical protein